MVNLAIIDADSICYLGGIDDSFQFDEDYIEYETLKGGYESFCEIKKIIDEVIERNE